MCIKTSLEDKDALIKKKKSKNNNDENFGVKQQQQQQQREHNKQKEITYAELRKHNLPWDAWVAIHGKVYDITEYAKEQHPGGDIILLGAGKDATLMYESYHSTVILESLKDSLQVGVMKPGELKESVYSMDSEFYSVMKKRVLARIREKGLTRRGSNEILIKAVLLVSSYWFLYYKLLTSTTTTEEGGGSFIKIAALCFLWAFNGGLLALGLSHDGNHGAFSNYRCLNKLSGWTMEWFGRSAHIWELQHNVSHHPYTNVVEVDKDEKKDNVPSPIEEIDPESDPDIAVPYPLIRFHSHFKLLPHHKYQHIYVPILVSFLQLSIFFKDIKEVRSNRVHHVDTMCRFADKWNVARFYIMKMTFILYTLLLPIYFHGVPTGLFIFFFGAAIRGQIVATIVIVSHVSEGSSYVLKRSDEENKKKAEAKVQTVKGMSEMEMELNKKDNKVVINKKKKKVPANDWAACQCQASLNWASGSWFWNHFSGGLNHQIEHHLFPGLCHTLNIHIHDVVRETCEEYGVPYKNHLTLSSIYKATLSHLKLMGTQEIIKQD